MSVGRWMPSLALKPSCCVQRQMVRLALNIFENLFENFELPDDESYRRQTVRQTTAHGHAFCAVAIVLRLIGALNASAGCQTWE